MKSMTFNIPPNPVEAHKILAGNVWQQIKALAMEARRLDGSTHDRMEALIEAGVRVPDDISVCGFDDIDLARICTPTLTTVAQPMAKIGHRAGEMLFALLEGRDVGERQVVLEYEVHLRQSTR